MKVLARRFGIGQWSLIGPGSEKKWYSSEKVHKEPGTILRRKCCWNLQKMDILLSVQRLHCPEVFSKAEGRGKLSTHFAADQDTIDTIYRIILSVNQLSVYGAVAAVCEEFENHQDRSGEPEILMGQSIVLGEVKAEALLHNENPMNDQIILQQYIQQVESLSPENKVSKFCNVRKQELCVLLKLDNIS